MKPASKTFQGTLERVDSYMNWVMVWIPFDAEKLWGKRGQLRVKGEINGFAFRSTLFPDGQGRHRLLVNKAAQRGAKTEPGMVARFRLEPDRAARPVSVPTELARALSEDRSLERWFARLNPSARNEIGQFIAQPKSPEARRRRAEQTAERLFAVMEAERELPPALEIAFAQNSAARKGWESMSLSRRRGHLFGIFYYRTVDARARRIAKAMEDAAQFAHKKLTRGA
jgi:uncharacterized protein YdeI (YjbR/CyaY-like superfamily)